MIDSTTKNSKKQQGEPLSSTSHSSDDEQYEATLRPKSLQEYVGQEQIKRHLHIFIQAAKKRKEPIEHVLVYGPPGLGKTTLAHVLAHEIGASIKTTSGPAIERAGDLASLLTNLHDTDILFIDEIHRLNKTVEEMLYPAMEDFRFDIILGKGPGARSVRLDLPHFTLIGATTRVGAISAPLRDRFGVTFRLDYYSPSEIELIIQRSATILNTKISQAGISEIALRARRTPRVANRLLKRVRDFAEVEESGEIDAKISKQALDMLEVDKMGLDRNDRMLLSVLIEKFQGGPVGLGTLAAATGEEEETISDIYEPYLMRLGLLERTPKGRKATPLAYEHLKINSPNQQLNKLL